MSEQTPRNPAQALGPLFFVIIGFFLWYKWRMPSETAALLMGTLFAVIAILIYLVTSYSGNESRLYGLQPIIYPQYLQYYPD